MNMNTTASAERIHIGFYGRRNAGKSSLVNAVTGQNLAVVSDVAGTTTDPVQKAMELLPLGPVVIIDTPGIDDVGELGALRVEKTRETLRRTHIAILVVDASAGLSEDDQKLLAIFREEKIPHLTVYNKSDLLTDIPAAPADSIYVSAKDNLRIHELTEMMAQLVAPAQPQKAAAPRQETFFRTMTPEEFKTFSAAIQEAPQPKKEA